MCMYFQFWIAPSIWWWWNDDTHCFEVACIFLKITKIGQYIFQILSVWSPEIDSFVIDQNERESNTHVI